MKLLRCILFLGLFLIGPAGCALGIAMAQQKHNESIIFIVSGKLYKVDIETASATQVSADTYYVLEVAALLDGRYVYTVRLGGEKPTAQTHLMFAPSWNNTPRSFPEHLVEITDISLSPDGEKLLFVARPSRSTLSSRLYCQNLATGRIKQLVPSGGVVKAPSWSPDGTQIAFYYGTSTAVLTEGGFALYVIDANGKNNKEIARPSKMTRYTPDRDVPPLWSPDSKILFFEANYGVDEVGPQIYMIGLNEAIPRRLGAGICTSYSIDCKKLYFCDGGIWVMNVDATQRKCLGFAEGRKRGNRPKLSPSGSLLAFVTWDGIYVMKPDGTGARKITEIAPSRPHEFYWVRE